MGSLLTSAEAAQKLRVSRTTIHRWVTTGRLPYIQKLEGIRGGYLFAPAAVDRLARQQSRRHASLRTAT